MIKITNKIDVAVAIILVIGFLIAAIWWNKKAYVGKYLEDGLYSIDSGIISYIKSHQGKFPEQDDEMWSNSYGFDEFTIGYGIQLQSLKEQGDKLYDSSTGERLLLISGPFQNKELKGIYEEITLNWYNEMKRQQRKE